MKKPTQLIKMRTYRAITLFKNNGYWCCHHPLQGDLYQAPTLKELKEAIDMFLDEYDINEEA